VDWIPGKQVVLPAPGTIEDAAKRTNGGGTGLDVETWYLATKDLAFPSK
jgi:peroxiredoxin (alkyl hydroperoxide reductase subunit C)